MKTRRIYIPKMRMPAAAAGVVLPLDAVAGATRAYGLRLLRAAYSGNAIRVRESGGDTLADIGFVGNDLDVAAMEAHCGANDGFIHTWYDQSTAGVNAVQATNGNQFQIVSAGTTLTDTQGNITAQNAGSPYYPITALNPSDCTILAVGEPTANGYLFANTAFSTQIRPQQATDKIAMYDGVNNPLSDAFSPGLATHTNTMIWHFSGSTVTFVQNKTARGTGTYDGSLNITEFLSGGTGAQKYVGFISQALFYPSALSQADRETLADNDAAYWVIA